MASLSPLAAATAWAQGLPDIVYERPGAKANSIDFSPSGQYLATRGEQGYVVTDVSGHVSESALDKLQASPHTQWLRSWES